MTLFHPVIIPIWSWPWADIGIAVYTSIYKLTGAATSPHQLEVGVATMNYWCLQLYWTLLLQVLALDLWAIAHLQAVRMDLLRAPVKEEYISRQPFTSEAWQHSLLVAWLVVAALLHLPDETRWEPYQVILIAMMTCFVVIPFSQLHLLVPTWQYISISMYFFAGLGKLNLDFMRFVMPNMLGVIIQPFVLPPDWMWLLQCSIPVFETLAPFLLLLLRRHMVSRQFLATLLASMHMVWYTFLP